MSGTAVVELGEGRLLLDLDFRDVEGLVAAYLIPEETGYSLVETGPASCRRQLLDGIDRSGVARSEVRHVFVTHIHLDHAGGVGSLQDDLPNATFYAHSLGVPHLVDPGRLAASARRAWGPASDRLWGPLVPVRPPRIVSLSGGERFPIRQGELQVLATPGHARHHLAFFDTRLRALFSGDGAGVRLAHSWRARPAVPPPDLDLEQLYASVETMRATQPRVLLYSHFGPGPEGASDLEAYHDVVEEWKDVALSAARERAEPGFIANRLREHEEDRMRSLGISPTPADRPSLISGYDLAAAGFLRYFQTRGLLPGSTSGPASD